MPSDLLEGFTRFSNRILIGIDNKDPDARKYKATLGLINQMMETTHGMVIERLDRLEAATSLGDAAKILKELNHEALTESFRVEGLCDIFEGLGRTLGTINSTYGQAASLTPDELGAGFSMAEALTNREAEVAGIYVDRIEELVDLIYGPSDDLEDVKRRARTARTSLTDQLSDFGAKSQRFLKVGP